jgi:hypothetical protein
MSIHSDSPHGILSGTHAYTHGLLVEIQASAEPRDAKYRLVHIYDLG